MKRDLKLETAELLEPVAPCEHGGHCTGHLLACQRVDLRVSHEHVAAASTSR